MPLRVLLAIKCLKLSAYAYYILELAAETSEAQFSAAAEVALSTLPVGAPYTAELAAAT